MTASVIQRQIPLRSCSKDYKNYSSYKKFLRGDFNKRCGYCDEDDRYSGYSRGFQIDHLKPQAKFLKLINKYENLVYSCPCCNRSKWDKWKSKDGFVDPCHADYRKSISRGVDGQIQHDGTVRGKYIHKELNLGLKRHALIWCIEKLKTQKQALTNALDSLGENDSSRGGIVEAFLEIQTQIDKCIGIFETEEL